LITPYASFIRRLGALFYDSLIVLALLIFSTWLLLPFTAGEPIGPGQFFYQVYLLLIVDGYYVVFWVMGGQTVGMRAWKIKLVSEDGAALSWRQAIVRLLWAVLTLLPAGIGLWAALFDTEGRAWYDRLAGTKMVRI
jgi:uncharacterized RDD family membrane protein YckC